MRLVGPLEALNSVGSVVAIIDVGVENCCYPEIIGAFVGSTIERSSGVS